MEDRRCRDVISEGKNPRCWREVGALIMEKREREAHKGLHKKNTSSKTLTGKSRYGGETDYHTFFRVRNFRSLYRHQSPV